MLLNTAFEKSLVSQSNRTIEHMLTLKNDYYEASKENMEIINTKFHDIKHQVAALRRIADGNEFNKYLSDLEKEASLFKDMAKTDNEPLNIILTEKAIYCQNKGIILNYYIEPESLNGIQPTDIYSLFGNALDNAIESAIKLSDEEKRVISVSSKRNGKIICINFDNYYEGDMKFKQGIPVTSKSDNHYHGFGIKSIFFIAKRYNGKAAISAKNGMFNLNVILLVK
jgi:sensor histidine kinase regulating citrate/malate metabolism